MGFRSKSAAMMFLAVSIYASAPDAESEVVQKELSQEATEAINGRYPGVRIEVDRMRGNEKSLASQQTRDEENSRIKAAEDNLRSEAERRAAYERTPEFKRKSAARKIIELRGQIKLAQKAIDKENEVGEVSGFVNSYRLRQLGEIIVLSRDEIERQWSIYRMNGGKAASVSELK